MPGLLDDLLDPPVVIFLPASRVLDERYVRARNVPRLVKNLDDASRFVSWEAAEAYIRTTAKLQHPDTRIVEVDA